MPPSAFARRGSLTPSPSLLENRIERIEHQDIAVHRNRYPSTSSSTGGSNLSRSSFSSEDAIQDDENESTDDTSAVDTPPSSASDIDPVALFLNPWTAGNVVLPKADVPAHEDLEGSAVGV
jgi:hypothetical protein